MSANERAVVFVVPGDLHLTEAGRDNHRVAEWMVEQVNGLIRPDFVQFIGDNVQHARPAEFHLFNDLRRRLQVPHFVLVGDHDVQDDPLEHSFQEFVGKPCGASSLGGFRFIRLCTMDHRPLGLGPEQVRWLRAEVDSAVGAGERVVIFQHHYPYQIWETFAGPGIDEWREVVQTRRVAGIFTGHTHYGQIANDGRNVVVATRSIGDPEGGPPGFTIGYLSGDHLAVTYRCVEDRGPVVLITHPREQLLATGPQHVVSGPDHLHARVWSAVPVVEVRGSCDGGEPFPLLPVAGGNWGAPLSGDRLLKGEHTLNVRATDEARDVGEQEIAFAVDDTGRYTAVPGVRPVVTSTAFC